VSEWTPGPHCGLEGVLQFRGLPPATDDLIKPRVAPLGRNRQSDDDNDAIFNKRMFFDIRGNKFFKHCYIFGVQFFDNDQIIE